ncbi:MAG: ATP-dependent zinc metalloprotease FtsH [Anaerolineae bacterium]|nr:ATP-dependent zinc metalloprotease FtsH [Anaerolineae bacterium]
MVRSNYWRNGLVYLLILTAIVLLIWQVMERSSSPERMDVIELSQLVRNGQVTQLIATTENKIEVTYTDAKGKETQSVVFKEYGVGLLETLQGLGVTPEDLNKIKKVEFVPPPDWLNILTALGTILPTLLVVGMIYFMFRQAQGTNNQALSFGKSRARMFTGDQPTVTFDDVAGVEEAKEELQEVVEFLKEPEKFIALGARIPKGVLLVGAPGTGKTLMAKAVSGEAGVPFFSISGSEFVEMFVGVGASRVRDLFDQAKRHSPCIVFVDEIDAVGRHRGAGLGGSHDEREQTLNQILVEMDGFDTDTNVIVVAATNRPDILDPALLRPGRFDRRVVLDRPDVKGREAILNVHIKGKPLDSDVDPSVLAKLTPGFVGADIENLVNEAAILAARRNKNKIEMSEFQEAIERVIAGPERKSRLITEDEKEIIAYHEAGHAIVQHILPKCDPVRKVTIVSRGMALGYTMSLPQDDHLLQSKLKFQDEMAGLLGGRVAEKLMFEDVTTGASNDLERVTKLSRQMVTRYGMSEKLGSMTFGQKEELVFLGREISEQRDYSEDMAQQIDLEVRRFIDEAYGRAEKVLTDHQDKLVAVATRLIEIETLDSDAFEEIMGDAKEKALAE